MIAYTMIGTNDVEKAETFYTPLMTMLGGKPVEAYRSEHRFWFSGPSGAPPFIAIGKPGDGNAASVGNGAMNAFGAANRDMVNQVHAAALAAGGTDEGAPGIRGDDPNGFYGAYFRDLDGNKVCIFCVGPA